MSAESPLAEEISSVPISGVENGGIDYFDHPRIAYGAEYLYDVAYNQGSQSTVIFQWSNIGGDWADEKNFYPRHITLYLEVEDEPYFMTNYIEGAAFYLYRGADEGDWFGNRAVLWVSTSASGRFMRKSRIKGNIGALLTSKAPTPNWKVTLRQLVGIEDHYFLAGRYYPPSGTTVWYAFGYQLAAQQIDTYEMQMNGSIKHQEGYVAV